MKRTDAHHPPRIGRFSTSFLLLVAVLLIALGFLFPRVRQLQVFEQARSAIEVYDLPAARKILENWVSKHPHDADAFFMLATIARRQGDIKFFRLWIDIAKGEGYPVEAIEQQKLFAETQLGSIDAARQEKLIREQPDDVSDDIAEQTYQSIATGYLATYRLKEAWQCADFWLQWRPNAVSGHLLKADVFERMTDPQNAIAEYREALKYAPDHVGARSALAKNLLSVNQVEEAEKILQGLVDSGDANATTRILLAEANQRLGNPEASKQLLEEAFDKGLSRSNRAKASLIRAQLLLAENEPQKALNDLLVSVELAPEEATAHFALSTALSRLGEMDLAQKHRDQAQAIQQNFQTIRELTGKMIEDPTNPKLRTDIGQLMINQGLIEEGLAWVRTSLQYDPNFAPAVELMNQYSSPVEPPRSPETK